MKLLVTLLPVLGALGLALSVLVVCTSPFAGSAGGQAWTRRRIAVVVGSAAGLLSTVLLLGLLRTDTSARLILSTPLILALLAALPVLAPVRGGAGGGVQAWLIVAFQLHIPWFAQTALAALMAQRTDDWFGLWVGCGWLGLFCVLVIVTLTVDRLAVCACLRSANASAAHVGYGLLALLVGVVSSAMGGFLTIEQARTLLRP